MTTVTGQPFKFRSGTIAKNRVALAPLTNMQSPTSLLSDDEYKWLNARIEGGFGIVTTCASHVTRGAQAWHGELGIFSDEHIPGLARLAEAGKKENAIVLPQLFHGGFRSPSSLNGVQPVSASEFEIEAPDFEKPRALLEHEILHLQEEFVAASVRAMKAGLPGVELHGANGYLFTQFLSPFTNRRKDQWGGNLANRARFLLDTVKAVRNAIGAKAVVGVRLSPENTKLIPEIDIDEMKEVAFELHQLGIDYLSLSLWDARKVADKYAANKISGTIVEQFRQVIPPETAIIVSGRIWSHADAAVALDHGADIVALGASGIANPNWPMLKDQEIARFPMSKDKLLERAVSDSFIEYLKRWNFVSEGAV